VTRDVLPFLGDDPVPTIVGCRGDDRGIKRRGVTLAAIAIDVPTCYCHWATPIVPFYDVWRAADRADPVPDRAIAVEPNHDLIQVAVCGIVTRDVYSAWRDTQAVT